MRETGTIIDIKDRDAQIIIERKSSCGNCGVCKFGDEDKLLIEVPNTLKAEIGDIIELEMETKDVLKASAMAYLIPLFGLVLGIIIGITLGSQMTAALTGIGMTAVGFVIVGVIDKKISNKGAYYPSMINIIDHIGTNTEETF